MGIDFTAFAQGFLEGTTKQILERKAKAADYEDKQRELAERNKGIVAKRKEVVARYSGLANQAKSLGASDEMVSAALASGPQGLVDLTSNLQGVKEKMGSRWTPEVAKNYVELPEGFQMPDMNINEQIQATFGLGKAEVGSTKVDKGTFFQRGMGYGAKDRVRAELDKEAFDNGYSILDINELAQQSEYQSLSSGSFMNFTTPKVFNPEDSTTESANINRMMQQATESVAYQELEQEYKTLANTAVLPGSPEEATRDARMKDIQSELRNIQRNFVSDFVKGRVDTFSGGGYMESMGNIIDGFLGTGASSDLLRDTYEEGAGVPVGAVEDLTGTKATAPEVAKNIETAGGMVETSPDAMVKMTHDSLPFDGGSVAFKTDENGNPVEATWTMDGEEYTTDSADGVAAVWDTVTAIKPKSAGRMVEPADWVTEEQSDTMSKKDLQGMGLKGSPLGKLVEFLPSEELKEQAIKQIEIKRNADPEAWYKVVVPGLNLNRPMKVKGADLFFIPDDALVRGYNNITIDEFGMDDDLPKKTYTKRKIQKTYETYDADMGVSVEGADKAQDTPDGSVRPEMRPEGLGAKPEEAPAKEGTKVSADQEKVIQTYGRDIMKFMEEEGFTGEDSDEELAQGLADWYAANSEKLDIPSYPRDQGPIISLIKRYLKKD